MVEYTEYIEETVKKIAKKRGYDGDIGVDDNILYAGIDSLDIMEIIMSAENKFNVRVDDKKISSVNTINEIANLFKTVG